MLFGDFSAVRNQNERLGLVFFKEWMMILTLLLMMLAFMRFQ